MSNAARLWVAEADTDVEDMAVPDDGPVVPHQSLAHAVVLSS